MNRYLVAGGIMSGLFALLHVAIIIGGPEWYLFFGAGQEMADMAALKAPGIRRSSPWGCSLF